jgi:hypothetical protein
MTYQSTFWKAASITARLLSVFWGIATIFPAGMASDSGTDLAVTGCYVLLMTCVFFVLAGVFAKWSLAMAAIFVYFMVFIPFPEKLHLFLLRTVVPVIFIVTFLYAFGWLPPMPSGMTNSSTIVSSAENGTQMGIYNETEEEEPLTEYTESSGGLP